MAKTFILSLNGVATFRTFQRYPRSESPKAFKTADAKRVNNDGIPQISGIAFVSPGPSRGKHKSETAYNAYLWLDIYNADTAEFEVHYSRLAPIEVAAIATNPLSVELSPVTPSEFLKECEAGPTAGFFAKAAKWDAAETMRDEMLAQLRAMYAVKASDNLPTIGEQSESELRSEAETTKDAMANAIIPEAEELPAPVETPKEAPKRRRTRATA